MPRRGLHWMIVVMALVLASCGDDPAPRATGPVEIPLDDLTSDEREVADAMLAALRSEGLFSDAIDVDGVVGCTARAVTPKLSAEAKRLAAADPESLSEADDALVSTAFDACTPEGLVGELFVEAVRLGFVQSQVDVTLDAEERRCMADDFHSRYPDDSLADLEALGDDGTVINAILSRCAGVPTAVGLMSSALAANPGLAPDAPCLADRVVADLGVKAVMRDLLSTTDALSPAVQRGLDEAMAFC